VYIKAIVGVASRLAAGLIIGYIAGIIEVMGYIRAL